MALNPKEVEGLHGSTRKLLEIWMKTKLAIQRGFGKEAISKEHETAFLNLKSDMSRLYRSIGDRLPKDLQFEGDEMMDMMKNAMTLQQLQTLPIGEKKQMFAKWHKLYVLMTRTYGALEVLNDGYYPSLHRDLMKPKPKKQKIKPTGSR